MSEKISSPLSSSSLSSSPLATTSENTEPEKVSTELPLPEMLGEFDSSLQTSDIENSEKIDSLLDDLDLNFIYREISGMNFQDISFN